MLFNKELESLELNQLYFLEPHYPYIQRVTAEVFLGDPEPHAYM